MESGAGERGRREGVRETEEEMEEGIERGRGGEREVRWRDGGSMQYKRREASVSGPFPA